ncbi:MAG TPA: tetrahydrofolate dehydrogenase/cyclohydrolase catalytic domain-containing protein, partial [Clostridia bacterium]|nr:tetrahydrofolate dehydrogenase/cyclohydrolase catalytic domain-containing protein [Clostridia bacterium]
MAQIIDGKSIAATERELLVARIEKLKAAGVIPGLCVILVGEDPASLTYVSSKEKMAHALNMKGVIHRLPAETSQQELIKQIELLNADDSIHGILVQLPLPSHLDADAVAEAIIPEKDIDGLHP